MVCIVGYQFLFLLPSPTWRRLSEGTAIYSRSSSAVSALFYFLSNVSRAPPNVRGGNLPVLRLGGVHGRCGANSLMRATLGSIDLGLHSGRFITVLNPSNSNGAALLGVVNNLSQCSDNSLIVGKVSAGGCASHS